MLITASADEGSELAVLGLDGVEVGPRIAVPSARLYSVTLSPDGSTAAAWGSVDTIVTIDLATGRELGRLVDPSLSLAQEPWLSADELVVVSWPLPGDARSDGVHVSIRSRDLVEVASMDVVGEPHATLGGVFAVTDAGVSALDAAGGVTVTAPPQTSLTGAMAALGAPASPPPSAPATTTAAPSSPVTPPPRPPDLAVAAGSPVSAARLATVGLGLAGAAVGAVVLFTLKRRRH